MFATKNMGHNDPNNRYILERNPMDRVDTDFK